MKKTLRFFPEISRRFPDPLKMGSSGEKLNIEHHLLISAVKKIPDDIPTDPNPRDQNTDKLVYKKVKESLLNEDDLTFHLKNKGITIIADSVRYHDEGKEKYYEVIFSEGTGIVDGGHTYKIIQDNKEECPVNQFVKIEILSGINKDLSDDIAQGLNTSVQVTLESLSNLEGSFTWIKDALKNESYSADISYKENEDGEYSIRDIISFLIMFNIELFPDSFEHPKVAYTSKEECLKRYLVNQGSFEKLRPIMKDILKLYDYINLRSRELYNDKFGGRAAGLSFFNTKKRGEFKYIFIDEQSQLKLNLSDDSKKHKLFDGALYPILGSFRCLVEEDPKTGNFKWKVSSFKKVIQIFDKVGAVLVYSTKTTSDNSGRNPNAIGKNGGHWDTLYTKVENAFFRPNL